ncbi:MAG: type IV pilus twitching motility protein PilT [Cyanobacteria bacterium]|jgi:twitching motility protein PilT|nr:type IV pilus twitching motility protein PilT [Candidatus Melainabacteria bacterium]MDA0771527.1 type IV pilus twitching motility protein PilT [Cyanobacteriota bacterium]MDA1020695.1 type IV pilus twitching motility protein PilT [Cyanobacteriota bacterium]
MIKKFLQLVLDTGASDLHISAGEPPMLRINGVLQRTDFAIFDKEQVKKVCYSFLTEKQAKTLDETNELDLSHGIDGMGRFRINVYKDRLGYAAAFRIITENIPSLEQLGLPATTKDVAKLPRGLVLVTGPTGSGKSTTLAAIMDWINTHRAEHILTIEDPIEFVHKSKKSLINQREVGADTYSFSAALKSALREDPDVILIGEMRDLETISLAVTAAETGHLVFGTLHTSSAATTIDRLVDVFPHEQQAQIRIQLSGSLKAVLSQTLLPKKDGSGRCMAMEIMTVTPAISNLIREGKTSQIYSAIQTGRKEGMQTLESSLADLYKQGLVRIEDIIAKSSKADELRNLLGSDVITQELLAAG